MISKSTTFTEAISMFNQKNSSMLCIVVNKIKFILIPRSSTAGQFIKKNFPLFCTVAQTGQFFDFLHRPGNVHDSNGADEFMLLCFENLRAKIKGTIFESRMDSAFFSKKVMSVFDDNHVEITA